MENITSKTEYENTPDIINILRAENERLKHSNFSLGISVESKEIKITELNKTVKNMSKLIEDLTKNNSELQKEIKKLNEKIINLELNQELDTWNKKRK